jgi:hypothetical protein
MTAAKISQVQTTKNKKQKNKKQASGAGKLSGLFALHDCSVERFNLSFSPMLLWYQTKIGYGHL